MGHRPVVSRQWTGRASWSKGVGGQEGLLVSDQSPDIMTQQGAPDTVLQVTKEEQGKREKNLTVKPIRIQLDEPKHTLKRTLNIEIRASEVRPLLTQIAGHGSENDGRRGLLMHESGLVLKPVQDPPKGTREVAFYNHLSNSTDPVDMRLARLTAKFFGTESVRQAELGVSDYLVLENLTEGFLKPCVMDVKIGSKTYGPDATEAKKMQEDAKYTGTKQPFGFSVLGIISHNEQGFKRLTKAFGRHLSDDNIDEVLHNFLRVEQKYSKLIAKCFLEKLEGFLVFFSSQTLYHIYASSLLFVYDFDSLEKENFHLKNPVRLKLIDFAHVFPGNGELDSNFLFGLQNITELFRKYVAEDQN